MSNDVGNIEVGVGNVKSELTSSLKARQGAYTAWELRKIVTAQRQLFKWH